MRIYNSMTKRVEPFRPIEPNKVSMYVCGPTVYDHPHIGNARPLVVFDMMMNVFLAQGYEVDFVSNYTDIDDRIIDKAKDEGVAAATISERYIKSYENLKKSLNNNVVKTVKVTDTVTSIIAYIAKLIELGFAYEVNGDVYFRVDKIEEYGRLSGQIKEELMIGARIEESLIKESPLDFTLWKKTQEGERYESPWSMGRPGWHTECVVMIQESFQSSLIDIHGGGLDLKFPHHENEIAQSCASNHSPLANYWVHNGMINFDGNKMSKSLGNIVLAKDLVAQYGGDYVRWFLLSAHYRAPLKFNEEMIAQSNRELEKIYNSLNRFFIDVQLQNVSLDSTIDGDLYNIFLDAIKDDFNTPNAYKVIFDGTKEINQMMRKRNLNLLDINPKINSLIKMLSVLGIAYQAPQIENEDIELYHSWEQAKENKDFQKADNIRERLQSKGLL